MQNTDFLIERERQTIARHNERGYLSDFLREESSLPLHATTEAAMDETGLRLWQGLKVLARETLDKRVTDDDERAMFASMLGLD